MIRKALMSILVILVSLASAFASAEKPVFALVLSGGGARGLTHIPVIQELEKRGIVPDMVLGTSMGALVGGLYAAGYDGDALEEVALNENLQDAVYSMPPMRTVGTIRSAFDERPSNLLKVEIGDKGIGSQLGVLDDTKVNNLLMKLFSRVMVYDDFDDLPIPFRAIGTDVTNNKTVVFGSGSFFDAVRASMAFPVVFAPVILEDGSVVVDGGVTANLPVNIARELGADYILAVDCGDALGQYKDEDEDVPPETLTAVISQIIDTMLSFNIWVNILPSFNVLLAKPCTTIAEDWIPTFPPVPPINGIKSAILGLVAIPVSNPPRITELLNPPIIPIKSQGRRAAVCVNTLSEVSTSCEIPDANW